VAARVVARVRSEGVHEHVDIGHHHGILSW
jgi:hypothetical protein